MSAVMKHHSAENLQIILSLEMILCRVLSKTWPFRSFGGVDKWKNNAFDP
jgi:hypothetical protein